MSTEEFPHQFDVLFRDAVRHRDAGEFEQSLGIIDRLALDFIHLERCVKATAVFRGHLLWEMGRFEEAAVSFQDALRFNPCSKKLSMCVFHMLLRSGQQGDAVRELERFMTECGHDDEQLEIYLEQTGREWCP